MKFICDNCKTKYQIADEKTAGKTVRMKCRKCGHAIEVRAAVTETSGMAAAGAQPSETQTRAPEPTTLPHEPNAVAATPSKPPPRPAPPRPPPRKPATSERPPGALANAFQRSVKQDEEVSASMDLAELSAADEWYVAIGGVPVGPVPIAEVRQRAAAGAVTEDSLCWQEGLEEWRPVRSFPELAKIVRQAAENTGGRVSVTSTSESYMGHSPAPPPAAERVAPRPAPGPVRPAQGSRPSDFGMPLAQLEGAADAGEDPTVAFTGAIPGLARLDRAAADPVAAPAPADLPPARRPLLSNETTVATRNKREIPWIIIGILLGFMTFGAFVGIGVVMKLQAPPPAAPVAIAPPPVVTAAPIAPQPAAVAAPASDVLMLDPAVVVAPAAKAPVAAAAKTAAPAAPAMALDLKGLRTSQNVAVGDDPAAAARASGQCYTSGQITQVVGQHSVALRRTCWERAATGRAAANTSVSLTIGPGGKVESISATGDDPAVAHCIENNVRTWQFPALGCSQPTAIPFHFVRE